MPESRNGVVLAGAGARGAYAAGVLSAVATMLPPAPRKVPRIDTFCGMSMGAFNAAWLAAHAWDVHWNTGELLHVWHEFNLEDGARGWGETARGLLRGLGSGVRKGPWSLLESEQLERRVAQLPWSQLHANITQGRVSALLVPGHRLDNGTSVVFAESADGVEPHHKPTAWRETRIAPRHLMASASLPTLLPARQLEDGTYCDGAFRMGNPLAPPLWCGAERLLVVSTASSPDVTTEPASHAVASGPAYVLGKLLHAALLDPLTRDLERLETVNELVAAGASSPTHRTVETLVIQPSADLGVMASEVAAELRGRSAASRILGVVADLQRTWEADFYSYLLMDGAYTRALTSLGRHDAFARQDEIEAFFEPR